MIKHINKYNDKNVMWHFYRINREDRERLHQHRSMILWFTGLSGSGKSTLASILEEKLYCRGVSTYSLDGDNIRHGLCKDLSFNSNDRSENIRRVGEVARLMVDAGLVVLVALISPYRIDRQIIRDMCIKDSFLEIFVDTPMLICKQRDPKGLYHQVDCKKIKNFTGIDSIYERPKQPDIYLDGRKTISELINQLLDLVLVKIFK